MADLNGILCPNCGGGLRVRNLLRPRPGCNVRYLYCDRCEDSVRTEEVVTPKRVKKPKQRATAHEVHSDL